MDFIWGILLGLLIGFIVWGWKRSEPHEQYTRVWIQDGPRHAIILYSLDAARLRALAERFKAGRPFRYKSLVGRGKLLRRSEWDKLTRECVQREIMTRGKDRIYSLTPTGEAFFSQLAETSHARAQR